MEYIHPCAGLDPLRLPMVIVTPVLGRPLTVRLWMPIPDGEMTNWPQSGVGVTDTDGRFEVRTLVVVCDVETVTSFTNGLVARR